MAITTVNELEVALDSRFTKITGNRSSLSNATAGAFFSTWRSTGQPGQGAIPTTTPTVPNHTAVGAFSFMQQTSPATSYLGELSVSCANANTTVEIHDRLVQHGGFVGNVTTAQTITGFDLSNVSLTVLNNLPARIGDTNYSDVQWWLEWYADTGATASNATINVNYNDGTTGNLTVIAVGGTVRTGRMLPLNNLIPAADSGKYIRGVNSLTLSASTGTAGNFGVTATRYRAAVYCEQLNKLYYQGWTRLGLPEIYNNSCLFPVVICGTTTTGIVNILGKIVRG